MACRREGVRLHPGAHLRPFLWQRVGPDETGDPATAEAALEDVLRSEHAHCTLVWGRPSTARRSLLQALAREGGSPAQHGPPAPLRAARPVDRARGRCRHWSAKS
jgi:hypothetical protein